MLSILKVNSLKTCPFISLGSSLFERILCNVETTDGLIQAWTYRWTGSEGTRIESGEWSKR